MNTKCSSAKCSRQTDIRGMHSLIRVPGIPTASRVEAGKIKMCFFEAAGVAHTRHLQVSIALGCQIAGTHQMQSVLARMAVHLAAEKALEACLT